MTKEEAAARIGFYKSAAVGDLLEALTVIRAAPHSPYLTGEKARIQAAIAILMGETYKE